MNHPRRDQGEINPAVGLAGNQLLQCEWVSNDYKWITNITQGLSSRGVFSVVGISQAITAILS